MSDDHKKPKLNQEFNKEADQRTVADKDGTQQKHQPKNVISQNARSMSPMGTVAVKGHRNVNISVISEEVPDKIVPVNLDRTDVTVAPEYHGLNVLVKIEQSKHKNHIDGGHISRLTVTEGEIGKEDILAHFVDGEWLESSRDFRTDQAIEEALVEYNGIEIPDIRRPDFPPPDRDI